MKVSDSFDLANQIMGDDFISPLEISASIDIPGWHIKPYECFEKNFPDIQTLEWAKENNFILVPGTHNPYCKTIVTLPYLFHSVRGLGLRSYAKEESVSNKMYMIRKEPLKESFAKTWEEQQALVPESEYIPSLIEIAWCISIFNEVRGAKLLQKTRVRSSSNDPDAIMKRIHADLGDYDNGKFVLSEFTDFSKNPRVGLLTAKGF